MISSVRKLLENWVARAFFGLLVIVFVFWGISNVVTLIGANSAIAKIGGRPIDISLVQASYETALEQARQSNPNPDANARQQLAQQALGEVLRQQTMALEASRLGVAAPNDRVRQIIYGIPAFQSNGVFSQAVFEQVLQSNNRTPDQFIGAVKDNLLDRQILLPVIGGVGPPAELVNQIFSFVSQQRFAETVSISIAGQPAPKPPPTGVLQRYWRNHPGQFTSPEYRVIKMVVLSPALLATNEPVSDADINAAVERATEGMTAVPLRTVEIITTADPAKAASLAAAWRNHTDWAGMQALAKQQGANPIELDNAQQVQFPSALLGSAVFSALPGEVTGPLQGPFGLFVFKVVKVSTSVPVGATLIAHVKQQLQLQKAQADVARDVNALQDALAGQTPLDKLPGNIGLVALQGTLDANGNTMDGDPAPIPGGPELKSAIVKAAFAAPVNQPAQLQDGPNGSYFALTVQSDTPPDLQDYDQVKAKVLADWTADQESREAEVKAADLLAAVNAGQDFDSAASAAGFAVTMTPPITRNAPPNGITSQMVPVLFSLQPGQATMQQTDTGFVVAVLNRVVQPTPQEDPGDYAQVYSAMAKSIQNDLAQSFVGGLQVRDKVTIDQKMFAQIYQ
jgi:peptidyl-prolyl cis-trans isomerase D